MEYIATISSKNQITVPADARYRLGLQVSGKVAFVVSEDGEATLRAVSFELESILSQIPALPGESLDLDAEIEETTAEAIEARLTTARP